MTRAERPDPIVRRLHSAFAPARATDAERLHRKLVEDATRRGLLDIAYRTIDTPLGRLLLAATSAGLARVAFECENHDRVLADLAGRISPRILRAPARLDRAARQIDEFFARRRRAFALPLDLQLAHGFRRTVLDHLPEIAYGHTASYAEVAKKAGNPAAVRAAASACSHNPLPLVLPCHRVVRSDGGIGEYLGGTKAKAALLGLEARGCR